MVNGGGEGATLALDTADVDKNDTKKRRFLRGLRRMFRRRGGRSGVEAGDVAGRENGTVGEPPATTPSTTRLHHMDDGHRRKSGSAHQAGLSVSHDSVFTAEASGASGGESDEERARSTSSASDRRRRHHHHHHHHHGSAIPITAELAAAVRRRARGDTSEEDEDLGLPRSPPSSPPKRGNGVNCVSGGGREQSSCSEGSLLSAGSSQSEDDCRSSRGELTHSAFDSSDPDGVEQMGGLAPLSHSAARHKMAIKPRRTHGAPRRNRAKQISPGSVLPTTPEVNEEITRSVTPEVVSSRHQSTDSTMTSVHHSTTMTSHLMTSSTYQKSETVTQYSTNLPSIDLVSRETRLKSSSLPPGLALSQMVGQAGSSPMKMSISSSEELGHSVKISRSKSSAHKADSNDTDESGSFNEPHQSLSERNLSNQLGASSGVSLYKSMDMKLSNVISGELQRRFGSVGEEEELLSSGNFDSLRPEQKNRKSNDKTDKIEKHSDQMNKSKYLELEDVQEKHSNKKEESFFGRLLLRRSGKKNKKDSHNEKEDQIEENKKQSIKDQTHKSISTDPTISSGKSSEHGIIRQHKMMCSDQNAHKTVGQKVFSNQPHKRIDPRGGYTNDPLTQEPMINFSKGSATDFGFSDIKSMAEREKLKEEVTLRRLSGDSSAKGGHQPRIRQRMEPMDIPESPDQQRKPPLLPRNSAQEPKGFFPSISQGKVYPSKDAVNGGRYTKNTSSKLTSPSDDFNYPHSVSPMIKVTSDNVFSFNSSTQPIKQIDASMKPLSYSVSPPRTVWPQNYEHASEFKSSSQGSLEPHGLRHSKSDYETRYFEYMNNSRGDFDLENSKARPKIAGLSSYQQKISQIGNLDSGDGDMSFPDSASSRNPVVKSHSFRLNSDVLPMASQQDMPSLPPMFGISESSMDSWESTYKKNIQEVTDAPSSLELGSDSLITYPYKNNSTTLDESFTEPNAFTKENLLMVNEIIEESLKPNMYTKQSKPVTLYNKSVSVNSSKARDDISRIEANIDSIIGNPKPLNCITLKSSSLDSVKSFDKSTDQNRKAYSNESISNSKIYLNQTSIPDVVGSVSFTSKLSPEPKVKSATSVPENLPLDNQISESHVSVTVVSNIDNVTKPTLKTPEPPKANTQHFDFVNDKSPPKPQITQKDTKSFDKSSSASSVPEFMKIQLNKVDQKPASNVVLSTGPSIENKAKTPVKNEINGVPNNQSAKKLEQIERSVSYDPVKTEKIINHDFRRSDSSDKYIIEELKEPIKPHRKFSSEDVEILEKSEVSVQNNAYNIHLKKTGSQSLLNRSTEILTVDNSIQNALRTESKVQVPTSLNLRKSPSATSSLPPPSPTAHKNFIRKKSGTFDSFDTNSETTKTTSNAGDTKVQDSTDKNTSSQNMKRISSHELLVEQNKRIDRSSSSSDDCNLESTVIFRKKSISSMGQNRPGSKNDDEPELMKVFARRSLKLKDSETDAFTQDILKMTSAGNENSKEDACDDAKRGSRYDFNVMTRSRDSDKENEVDSPKEERKKSISENDSSNKTGNKNFIEFRKHNNETAELMQAQRMPKKLLDSNPIAINNATNIQASRPAGIIGFTGYQRTVSCNLPLINNVKNENNNKSDANNYKKDVSDLTPEKRYRNRTFPDSTNENKIEETVKTTTKSDIVDTSSLPKRPWSQIKSEENLTVKDSLTKPLRKSSFASITTEVKIIPSINKTTVIEKPSSKVNEKLAPIITNKVSSEKISPTFNNKNIINDKTSPTIQTLQEVDEKSTSPTETTIAENGGNINEADASPQFKGILQMKAEWERRAKQAMTK